MDDLFGSTPSEPTVPVLSTNVDAFADPAADFIASSDADLEKIESSSATEIEAELVAEEIPKENESTEKTEEVEAMKLNKWEIEQKDRISKMGWLI